MLKGRKAHNIHGKERKKVKPTQLQTKINTKYLLIKHSLFYYTARFRIHKWTTPAWKGLLQRGAATGKWIWISFVCHIPNDGVRGSDSKLSSSSSSLSIPGAGAGRGWQQSFEWYQSEIVSIFLVGRFHEWMLWTFEVWSVWEAQGGLRGFVCTDCKRANIKGRTNDFGMLCLVSFTTDMGFGLIELEMELNCN